MSHLHLPIVAMLLVLTSCQGPNARVASKLNSDAVLTGLPMKPLQSMVITSGVNREDETMFSLFGNSRAVQHARTDVKQTYPAGSQLFLVIWRSQEDIRWFGGRIPAAPKTVEVLGMRDAGNGQLEPSYIRYAGSPLKEAATNVNQANSRIEYLLSLRAAVMP